MLYLKTDEEVGFLRNSNILVSRTLAEIARAIRPGITTLYLDSIAESFIRDNGAVPAFKGYGGFPGTLCTSVNDEVVHGIPSDYILKEGDILSVDCGVILNGWYGDSAYTFAVGTVRDDKRRLLDFTRAGSEVLPLSKKKSLQRCQVCDSYDGVCVTVHGVLFRRRRSLPQAEAVMYTTRPVARCDSKRRLSAVSPVHAKTFGHTGHA